MEKSTRSQILEIVLKIVGGLYGIQVFLILPAYLGMVCRHERAMWVWQEFERVHEKRTIGEALLEVYCYLIFYSGLFVVPFFCTFCYFAVREDGLSRDEPRDEQLGRDQLWIAVLISAWIAGTFLMFPESVIQFLHNLPWDGPSGWLIIGWVALRVYIAFCANEVVKRRLELIKRRMEGKV